MEVEFVYKKHAGRMAICGFKVDGVFKTTQEWATEYNLSYPLLYDRIRRGMKTTRELFAEVGTLNSNQHIFNKKKNKIEDKDKKYAIVNGYRILV